MSENNQVIHRELKIDNESHKKDFNELDKFLKTVSKKFEKQPFSIENLDKAYMDILDKNKTEEDKNHKAKKVKKQEEKAIFYDIFIKPKENKIKELTNKRNEQKALENKVPENSKHNNNKEEKLFISNKVTDFGEKKIKQKDPNNSNINLNNSEIKNSTLKTAKDNMSNATKIQNSANTMSNYSIIQEELQNYKNIFRTNLSKFIKIEEYHDPTDNMMKFLREKFITTSQESFEQKKVNKNFFNQLIQIKPPEGINAVVASPLTESKGWAPSIPSIQIDKSKTSLSDLMMRAKGGIQAGDIPKEAHMAFYLGLMNEEEKKYEEALKFYKKYFLSAKLLQDIYGTELALNRIAVIYSNLIDFDQSLYYNEKHKDITTHNINGFVAAYNCGVCERIIGKYEESINNFNIALRMSKEENDLESYTVCLCQISISHLFIGDIESYLKNSEDFFNKNKILKHAEMELEMLMLTGYVYNVCDNYEAAKESYTLALKQSSIVKNEEYRAVALSNLGIIESTKYLDDFMNRLGES